MTPTTEAGRQAVKMHGLFAGETEQRRNLWVRRIEEQAVAAERDRLAKAVMALEGFDLTVKRSYEGPAESLPFGSFTVPPAVVTVRIAQADKGSVDRAAVLALLGDEDAP